MSVYRSMHGHSDDALVGDRPVPWLLPSSLSSVKRGRFGKRAGIEPVGGQPGKLIVQTSQEIAYPLTFDI
jgi:hypothetical protein